MKNAHAALGLSGFQEWSEPVIYDRLLSAYQARAGTGPMAHRLARLHAQSWRALISGDVLKYDASRRLLTDAVGRCDLDTGVLAAADFEILDELLDVVLSRYQRSMRTAKGYHLALIDLAGRLAPPLQAA